MSKVVGGGWGYFHQDVRKRVFSCVAKLIWGQKDDWRWNFCATIRRSRDIRVQTSRFGRILKGGYFHGTKSKRLFRHRFPPKSGTKSRLALEFYRSDTYFSRYQGFKLGMVQVRITSSRFCRRLFLPPYIHNFSMHTTHVPWEATGGGILTLRLSVPD